MRSHTLILGLATLALTACGAPANEAPEDSVLSSRRVTGEVDDDDVALAGSGTLATAVTAQVVTIEEDGTTTVNGSAAISADGTFAVDAEGMTRTFVVQLLDAEGELAGSAVVTAEATGHDDIDAGTIDSETTVEGQVWTDVVTSAGFDTVVSSEVRARIDAETAVAAQAWFDAHAEADDAFSALASATVSASLARKDQAASEGVTSGARAQADLRGALDGVEDEADLAAALDAAFEAQGVEADDRSVVTARAEATFRAALAASLDGSDSTGHDVLDAANLASGQIEVWGHADAWAQLASDATVNATLAAELQADLRAAAEDAESTDTLTVELDATVQASVQVLIDGLLESDSGIDLGALVGLDGETDTEVASEAIVDWSADLRAELQASLQATAEAHGDAQDAADATAEAWASVEASVDAALADAGASDDTVLRAALMLSVGAFTSGG